MSVNVQVEKQSLVEGIFSNEKIFWPVVYIANTNQNKHIFV
jgi:hypothetical protein